MQSLQEVADLIAEAELAPDALAHLQALVDAGVEGVDRYRQKLVVVARSVIRKRRLGDASSVEESREEFFALSREGAIALCLAGQGLDVRMEPLYPAEGPDLEIRCAEQSTYVEVKRLRIQVAPSEKGNRRPLDTVAASNRQLREGAPNLVVIVDRDVFRDWDAVDASLSALPSDASENGVLKRVSAVMYQRSVAVKAASERNPEDWVLVEFPSGVPIPDCVQLAVFGAFGPRVVRNETDEEWMRRLLSHD